MNWWRNRDGETSKKNNSSRRPDAAPSKRLPAANPSRDVTDRDIARRAFELYGARRGEHGHGLDDWL